MAVLLSPGSVLRQKKVKLRYYKCDHFTFDRDTMILFVPYTAKPLALLSVLLSIE